MTPRHAHALLALTLCGAPVTSARAQAPDAQARAPLAVGVLSLGPDAAPARDALYAVLDRSPNVDARAAADVAAAFGAILAARPAVDLAASRDAAADLMAAASIEGLLVLSHRDGALVVESFGPDGRLLETTRHDDLTPDDASARAIVRAAFDRIGPVTLAWRALNAPRGGSRPPSTSPEALAAAPVEPGAHDPRSWTIAVGLLTSIVEIDEAFTGLLLGADVELALPPTGGLDEGTGFTLGLTIAPPQEDVTLLRLDGRALAFVLPDAPVSPELVVGAHMSWRDTPLDGGFVSFGPLLGAGIVVLSDIGALRLNAAAGLEIAPGNAFGVSWEARLQADLTVGPHLVLSPRTVRRVSFLEFSPLSGVTLITWETDLLFGWRF
jgi:hypothetical protein